jgi:hypothetical protein
MLFEIRLCTALLADGVYHRRTLIATQPMMDARFG